MAEDYEGIALFAAIRTFYDNGSDVLSAVCSLVLVSINDGDSVETIRSNFLDRYKVEIPTAVVQTVVKRLRRDKYIDYKSFIRINVEPLGVTEISKLTHSINALNRDFKALIKDLNDFLGSKKYKLFGDVEKELLSFIDQNLGYASQALTASDKKKIDQVSSHIAEYIVHVEKSSPHMFLLLQNVFFGRLYLSMIKTRSDYSKNIKLEAIDVYLDTNIIMSLLGLHDEVDCNQANELLGVLKDSDKINVCVFDETIDEARRVLNHYNPESVNYLSTVKVNSIYYTLKRKGYDKYRVTLLIESIEERIEKLGIEINPLPKTDLNDSYYDVRNNISTWAELLNLPKTNQNTLDHDSKVIFSIQNLRKEVRSKLFEKCRAIFITPDRTIHAATGEIAQKQTALSLSMFPLDVVSMLWIREIGNEKIATSFLRQSVMAYVREKAISHKLWDTFVLLLRENEKKDRLSKEDIAVIMSSDEMPRILAEKQFDAPALLADPDFVDKLRKKAAKKDSMIDSLDNEIKEKNKSAKSLNKENATKRQTIDELNDKFSRINKKVGKAAKILSTTTSLIVWIIFLSTLTFSLYFGVRLLGVELFQALLSVSWIPIGIIIILLTGRSAGPIEYLLKIRDFMYKKFFVFYKSKINRLLDIK